MMKKLLALFCLLLLSNAAIAQSWQGDGTTQIARNWVASPTVPMGAMPVDPFVPADPGTEISDTGWLITGGAAYTTTAGFEKKARFLCEYSKIAQIDPILGLGQSNFGHWHKFVGNAAPTSSMDYTYLRANPSSNCQGGPENATPYWEPALMQDMPNGLHVVIKSFQNEFYYRVPGQLVGDGVVNTTWIRPNHAMIGGVNPRDFNDQARRNEYSAAGFLYPGSPTNPAGFLGWQCWVPNNSTGGSSLKTVTNTTAQMKLPSGAQDTSEARYLRGPSGEDPWGGTCIPSAFGNPTLIMSLSSEDCWDTHHLRSPDGRAHLAYSAIANGYKCPDGWAHIPQLTAKTYYVTTGPAEYLTWYLSSDRMRMPETGTGAACTDATVACPASMDPCRKVSLDYCNGATAHFDWMYGWKRTIFETMQRECLGITINGVAPTTGPADCDSGTIDSGHHLIGGGGASPDPTLSGGCAFLLSCSSLYVPGHIERYAVPDHGQGPVTLHGHTG